jgi:hypothetical protein
VAVSRVWNAVIWLGTSRESRFREAGRALIGRVPETEVSRLVLAADTGDKAALRRPYSNADSAAGLAIDSLERVPAFAGQHAVR